MVLDVGHNDVDGAFHSDRVAMLVWLLPASPDDIGHDDTDDTFCGGRVAMLVLFLTASLHNILVTLEIQ